MAILRGGGSLAVTTLLAVSESGLKRFEAKAQETYSLVECALGENGGAHDPPKAAKTAKLAKVGCVERG